MRFSQGFLYKKILMKTELASEFPVAKKYSRKLIYSQHFLIQENLEK